MNKNKVSLIWFVIKINERIVDCVKAKDAAAAFDYALDRWVHYAQRALREDQSAIIEVDLMPEKKVPIIQRASASDIAKYGIKEQADERSWPWSPVSTQCKPA